MDNHRRRQANGCDDEGVSSLALPPPTVPAAMSRPDFDRVAGPLMDHFFPDGPPATIMNEFGGTSDEDSGFTWPTSSSWNHPRHRGGGGARRVVSSSRRSRRVAVSLDDATQSLQQIIELQHGYVTKQQQQSHKPSHRRNGKGQAHDDTNPGDGRSYLSASQASALAWIACEIWSVVAISSQGDDPSRRTTTTIRSPLATHDNFRSLLRSIRICGPDPDDGPQRLHRAAILRLASFLRPIRGGGGGRSNNGAARKRQRGGSKHRNGDGGGDSSQVAKSQCVIVQFMHLLTFTQASVAPPRTGSSSMTTSYDETQLLFSVLASCCVHEATRRELRIDACRWVYHYLDHIQRTGHASPHNLRRTAQQLRQRLQQGMKSLRESSRRATTRKSNVATEPHLPSDATERVALASVLEAMARADPRCQDLVLSLPLVETYPNGTPPSSNGTRHPWHEFPNPDWENEFVNARQGLLPSSSRKRQRSDGMETPWLSRLKMQSSAAAGQGANSSSWQRWLGIEDCPTPSRRSNYSLLLDMLENRNLHHHMVLSSRCRHQHQHRQEDGEHVALKRLDTLLPFLLSDYAASIAPPPPTQPHAIGRRSSRSMAAHREREASSADSVSGMSSRTNALLMGIQAFAIHTGELPTAVQDFVETRMLPNWDGTGTLVPSIVSYWYPCSFDELYRRVLHRHIEPLLIHGDSALQYRIITCALTPMVENWSSKLQESSIERDELMNENQVQSLRDFIRWMDTTLVQLFVTSNDDCASNEDLLQLATLRFYTTLSEVELQAPALRLNVLPSPQLVYRLLLSASPFILDRLCHLLAVNHRLFSSTGEAELASNQAGLRNLVRSYVSDTCAAIVPCDRTRLLPDDDKARADFSPLFTEAVGTRETLKRVSGFLASGACRTDSFGNSHATTAFHGAAFAGFIQEFALHCTVDEADDRTSDRQTEHEGMQNNCVENRYLDYLRKRGFTGIHGLSSLVYRDRNGEA